MPEQRQEKPQKVSRQDLEAAIKAGCQVAVGADVYRKGPGGRPTPALPRPPSDPGLPDEFEAVIVRDKEGRLTQAGAEHAIRHGGGVLLGDEVHTDPGSLPDLEEYHARTRTGAVESMDRQIANLNAQRQQLAQDERAAHGREPFKAAPEWPRAQSQPQRQYAGPAQDPARQGEQPQGEQPPQEQPVPEAQLAEAEQPEEGGTRRGRHRRGE
jgi:hypothetical protein